MESSSPKPTPRLLISFVRAQFSSIISTAVDFGVFFLLKDIFGVWYVIANVIGALMGTIVNFLIGRYWVFDSTEGKIHQQAFRYLLVSIGSLLLNTAGIYFITEFFTIDPGYSKIIISILVGICYNFVLQKYFVFK